MRLTSHIGTTLSTPPFIAIGSNDTTSNAGARGILTASTRTGGKVRPGTRTVATLKAGSGG